MSTTASPTPWQAALSRRLAQALPLSRTAHAPLVDTMFDDASPSTALATRWRLPSRALDTATATAVLGQMLGANAAAMQRDLPKHCLQHYRAQLAADQSEDDLGLALAAYLGACRQAFDQEPLTPARWLAITQWLKAWVIDELPWDDTPLAERQDAFERFAMLTVALGEWTVQASRQGTAQQASATWMARTSLRGQLSLDLPELCAVLRSQDLKTAVSPSAIGDELGAAAYRHQTRDPV